jgi:hypothetical protein
VGDGGAAGAVGDRGRAKARIDGDNARKGRPVMAIANDLYPPIDAAVELETIGFDFGPALNAGVTITAILSVTCAVHPGSIGSDPAPASRLVGTASIVASKATGAANAAVAAQIGAMVGGVVYTLQCVVQTSDGQKLSCVTHIACQAPQ